MVGLINVWNVPPDYQFNADLLPFSVGNMRFIDRYGFLFKSLDYLAGCFSREKLKISSCLANGEEKLILLSKNGIYPCEYIILDSWERFNEPKLPEKEKFYSKLNDEHITDEEYEQAQKVWEVFNCNKPRRLAGHLSKN